MPFAITCPACQHKFRTAKEREFGKGVQCARCSEQFYISADNQEEVRESKSGPPPVPRQASNSRPSERDREEDDDSHFDEPVKPRRKKKLGKVLLIVGLLGFVMMAAAGTGVYFLFFSESGTSAEHKVQPKRELPMDVFVYRPSERASIEFYNQALTRENGLELVYLPPLESRLPRGYVFSHDQIESYCGMYDSDKLVPGVVVVSFVNPQEVGPIAAACRMERMKGNRPGLFASSNKSSSWLVFQAGPKRIVFVGSNYDHVDVETLAKVADRTAQNSPLQPQLQDGLAVVSGYSKINVSVAPYQPIELSFEGKNKEKSGVRESFSMRVLKTPAVAREQLKSSEEGWAKLSKAAKSSGQLELFQWVRGENFFWFERRQVGKGP